jgi:PAS domain S-box-containing protein
VPVFAWSCLPDGSADFFNEGWLEYVGLPLEAALGWGWTSVFHPDDADKVVAYWQAMLDAGEPGAIEARLRRFDGEYRWFLYRARPLRDDSGSIIKWYGTSTDIEDHKRAVEALRESELNFRLVIDTLPALVCTLGSKGELELINRPMSDYFGIPSEQLKGRQVDWTIHEEDLDSAAAKWRHSVATGKPYDAEVRVRRFDGVFRWFHVRGIPLLDAEGQHARFRFFVLLTDIEDRKRVAEALRTSEARLRQIIDAIPALVWCAKGTGEMEYINQRVIDYTGESLRESESAGWMHAIHPEDAELVARKWLRSVETFESFSVTCRLRGADGVYRWFESQAEPLRDAKGRVVNWYGLNIDVEESTSMLADLRDTRAKLSRASQIATVAELSASIAHEINQPLASVVANGHACQTWLSNEPPNLERAQMTLERIVRDGHSAAEVVRRIRALFKQAVPVKAVLDINEIIGGALRLIADEIQDNRIVAELDLAANLPKLMADRVQIQQALVNLLRNAAEAMEGVTDRSKTIWLRSGFDGRHVLVEIRDHGCGVANPRFIYDPFFTTKPAGMGMGLSICRSIIEAHGGRLWATANEDVGTTFSFTLPLVDAPSSR